MSADPQLFPPRCSPSFSLGAGEPPSLPPLSEMETLRMFVNERLTAAVDDILGLFGRTVARYRQQIDRQRRQLDGLRSEEGRPSRAADHLQTSSSSSSWMKNCPEDQILCVQLDQTSSLDETGTGTSSALTKTEAADGDGSDTEDSGDRWREAAGLWKPEETEATEGQRSPPSRKVESCGDASHPPVFGCKVCGESFQRRTYLLTHTSAHLRDCGVCGKHLERAETLRLHLRGHREASFGCGVCGQTFTLRGNLRTHMRIHSGERPHGCTVCGKSFGRRATLVRHVRSHTGEKPFACAYCGRGFVEKGNLTVHLRTHTGERPYWCSVCDRRFSQLSCFYKHPCQRRGLT
ncbi:zinc finger protein 771-like [Lates japonicus]